MAVCVSKLSQREKEEETQVHEGINSNEDPIRNKNEVVGMVDEINVTDALKAEEYKTPDLLEIVEKKCQHLNGDGKKLIFSTLKEFETVFEGKQGENTGGDVGIQLKKEAIPFWGRPYPIPLKNRQVVEDKVNRQCDIGAMRRLTPNEIETRDWCFTAFGTPKSDGTIKLVIDFRKINPHLVRRQYPMTTIHDLSQQIMGFNQATTLDFNMGYLSMPLTQEARKILTVVFPFGLFECLVLPQWIVPATDIFQLRMVALFAPMMDMKPDLYLDDILHTKGNTLQEHVSILRKILRRSQEAGLKFNAKK